MVHEPQVRKRFCNVLDLVILYQLHVKVAVLPLATSRHLHWAGVREAASLYELCQHPHPHQHLLLQFASWPSPSPGSPSPTAQGWE